ncbi:hypothetical protein EAG_01434 [Camponotus floridanus]|uniref:Uncharacterized protein n=1 Tax=Camponotus floridanus TaxID=104421 RepID=E2AV19_CAMFO|nr:hypothetical protein EAG_01434 [Camponotus floridanus]
MHNKLFYKLKLTKPPEGHVKVSSNFLNGTPYMLLHILVAHLKSFPKHYNYSRIAHKDHDCGMRENYRGDKDDPFLYLDDYLDKEMDRQTLRIDRLNIQRKQVVTTTSNYDTARAIKAMARRHDKIRTPVVLVIGTWISMSENLTAKSLCALFIAFPFGNAKCGKYPKEHGPFLIVNVYMWHKKINGTCDSLSASHKYSNGTSTDRCICEKPLSYPSLYPCSVYVWIRLVLFLEDKEEKKYLLILYVKHFVTLLYMKRYIHTFANLTLRK